MCNLICKMDMNSSNDFFQNILDNLEKNILGEVLISNDENEKEYTANDDWHILCRQKKRTDKTVDNLFKQVKDLMISPEIFEDAVRYFNITVNFENNKKLKIKKAIMCACVYLAYSIRGENRCENSLIEYFDIKKSKFTIALKLIKISVPEVRGIGPDVENQVYKICMILGLVENMHLIKKFISDIIHTPYVKILSAKKRKKEKHIHFAILYTWILINKNHLITPSKYSKLTGISKGDIIYILKNCDEFTEFLVEKYIDRIKNTLSCIKSEFPKINEEYFAINEIVIAKSINTIFLNIIRNKKRCEE